MSVEFTKEYQDGVKAFNNKKSKAENPYHRLDPSGAKWDQGYTDAQNKANYVVAAN
jgi:hypothetical protein